jgi:hypothetical protein
MSNALGKKQNRLAHFEKSLCGDLRICELTIQDSGAGRRYTIVTASIFLPRDVINFLSAIRMDYLVLSIQLSFSF